MSGEAVIEKHKDQAFTPTAYFPVQSLEQSEGWQTIHGKPVKPHRFNTFSEMRNKIEGIPGVCGFTTANKQKYAYINQVCPGEIDYKSLLIRKMIIDIETETEGGYGDAWKDPYQKINAITAWINDFGSVTWGLFKDYEVDHEDHEYRRFDSEEEMLHDFCKFVQKEKPDIISGWNVERFDIPYIINRIKYLDRDEWVKLLSPWKLEPDMVIQMGEDLKGNRVEVGRVYIIPGMTTLDYMDLYKKFCMSPRESYSLNNICYVELGEKKLDYSEYENLQNLYTKNWKMFIDYNYRDVHLVKKLDDKLKYFDLAVTYAYLAKVNFYDIYGTVNYWDVSIYNSLFEKKIAVPPEPHNDSAKDYPGGYVKDPQTGMHRWVSTFDLNSLYPNLIVQFNMSPETIINDIVPESTNHVEEILNRDFDNSFIKEHNVAMAANGWCFSKEKQGFIPAIVEKLYELRKDFKNKMLVAEAELQKKDDKVLKDKIGQYNATQYALKIALNSLYGAMANKSFRYFDVRIAGAITLSGQTVVRWTEQKTNKLLSSILKKQKDYIIAIDTDSVFLCFEDLMDKFYPDQSDVRKMIRIIDKIAEEKILPEMAVGFDELFSYLNGYKPRMVIKRESLADKGIWVAKKKYVMNVYNNEGVEYAEPKLKIRGLEIVRTSTPEICRDNIKKAVEIMFNKGEEATQDFIADFKKKFINSAPHEVAFPRSVNGLDKWLDEKGRMRSGVPIHVRSAHVYNNCITALELDTKYERIKEGEKIKFTYLKMPNPTYSYVIAFPAMLPKELDILEYIDYEMQFQKAFISPIETIMGAVGWFPERKVNINSLF